MVHAELQPCFDDHFARAMNATKLLHYQEITSSRGAAHTAYTGRYTQPDPMGSSAVSPYAYVDDNPIDWIDAWGLYKHKPGGPYHPSMPTKCTMEDSCSDLYAKIAEIEKTIASHQQWIKTHPEDTVHIQELNDWFNARNNCAALIQKKCNTKKECKTCQKAAVPAALVVGGYIVYKIIEACVAPWLIPVTP